MSMNLSNFKLLKEDGDSYHVGHPSGRKLIVGKQGLSDAARMAIEKLKGTPQHFDDGGNVSGPVAGAAVAANTNDVDSPSAQAESELPVVAPESSPSDATPPPAPTTVAVPVPMNPMQAQTQAFQQEKAGINAAADVAGQQATAESTAINKSLGDIANLPTQNDRFNDYKVKIDQLMQNYMDQKLDPNHYYANQDTGSKILSGVGLLLSGFGTGTGQPNLAMKVIDNAIDRDMQAQKNNQDKASNLWKMNMDNYQNEAQADLATKNQMLTGLKYKIVQAQNQFTGPMAKAQALQATAKIDQQLAANNFMMSQMDPSSDGVDPAQKVQYLPGAPETKQKALAEIGAAQEVKKNGPAILDAFDKSAGWHARDVTPFSGPNVDAQTFHVLMGPTFKDVEGSVREAAMNNIFNNVDITDQDRLTPGAIQKKRDALVGYLKSKSVAPNARSIGLNLQKYPSTNGQLPPSSGEALQAAKDAGYSDEEIRNYLNGRR